MEKSWFSKRLTSAKQKSVLYSSLAEIVQALVSSSVEPWLRRITNRKSIFSMGEDDLAIRTNELGQFFTIRTENSSSIPMLLQQGMREGQRHLFRLNSSAYCPAAAFHQERLTSLWQS